MSYRDDRIEFIKNIFVIYKYINSIRIYPRFLVSRKYVCLNTIGVKVHFIDMDDLLSVAYRICVRADRFVGLENQEC